MWIVSLTVYNRAQSSQQPLLSNYQLHIMSGRLRLSLSDFFQEPTEFMAEVKSETRTSRVTLLMPL